MSTFYGILLRSPVFTSRTNMQGPQWNSSVPTDWTVAKTSSSTTENTVKQS